MMQKMNTFTDFIDCAEHLVKHKYTPADRLVIQGGSAGGLLMGAVVNMRPDLFKAVGGAGAVRGRDQHDARRVAAAHDQRVHRVGQPEQEGGLRLHDEVLALRQHQGAALPVDAGARVAERQPGAVLGRREVRGEAAGHQDRHQPAAAEDQHGRRPRRRLGPLRRAARDGVHLCLHALADGDVAGARRRPLVSSRDEGQKGRRENGTRWPRNRKFLLIQL